MAVLLPVAAQAATFVVNSTADVVDATPGDGICATAGGVCTLRAAIQEANALPGPNTIILPAGTYTLTIPGAGEDASATGDLDITASVTIIGSGAATTIIDGGRLDRVLEVVAGAVTLSGVTIRGGSLPNVAGTGGGGGIRNAGTLTINDSIVSGNSGGGGGIFNTGTLTFNNSTISGNDGGNGAGGIYNDGATLTLNNSTVSGNTAGGEGGIRNSAGTMTLNNSTVSGNSAATYGGGIVNASLHLRGCSGATVTLNNSTVSGNTAGGDGGGIIQDPRNNNPATITLKNSIIADNTGSPNPNCSGIITSLGHNLSSDATCLGGPGDLNRPTALLGPLANNGGPTQTHAPLPGSAAIDAVPLANCTDVNGATIATDQRGVARPQGAACDIGSVDVKPQAWVLVIGLAGGYGDSIAASPQLFATQNDCQAAGQAWLGKVATLPSSADQWDDRRPAKFLCFQNLN